MWWLIMRDNVTLDSQGIQWFLSKPELLGEKTIKQTNKKNQQQVSKTKVLKFLWLWN